MLAKPRVRIAAITLGASLALLLLLYPTDERRVRDVAETLIAAVNANEGELTQALEQHCVPNVSVSVADLPGALTGRAQLMEAVGRARRLGSKPRIRLDAVEVSVEGKRARLNADLTTSPDAEVPELRRPRPSVAWFEERAGRFRLVSAEIGSERRDQPEARP